MFKERFLKRVWFSKRSDLMLSLHLKTKIRRRNDSEFFFNLSPPFFLSLPEMLFLLKRVLTSGKKRLPSFFFFFAIVATTNLHTLDYVFRQSGGMGGAGLDAVKRRLGTGKGSGCDVIQFF